MISTEELLLQNVLEFPDDDQPRLVLADWFDDNGHAERAEFIRLQCAVSRIDHDYCLDEECDCRKKPVMKKLALSLLHQHRDRSDNYYVWARSAPSPEPNECYTYRRGFLADVTFINPAQVASLLPKILAESPIEKVTVVATAVPSFQSVFLTAPLSSTRIEWVVEEDGGQGFVRREQFVDRAAFSLQASGFDGQIEIVRRGILTGLGVSEETAARWDREEAELARLRPPMPRRGART